MAGCRAEPEGGFARSRRYVVVVDVEVDGVVVDVETDPSIVTVAGCATFPGLFWS